MDGDDYILIEVWKENENKFGLRSTELESVPQLNDVGVLSVMVLCFAVLRTLTS